MFFSKKVSFFFKSMTILLLFVSLCIPMSCTKSDDSNNDNNDTPPTKPQGVFRVEVASALCMYWRPRNQYKLAFTVRVYPSNSISGNITSWKIIVKSGARQVIEINNTNFSSLGFANTGNSVIPAGGGTGSIILDQSAWQTTNLSSDKMEVSITVSDFNGYTQTLTGEKAIITAIFG